MAIRDKGRRKDLQMMNDTCNAQVRFVALLFRKSTSHTPLTYIAALIK